MNEKPKFDWVGFGVHFFFGAMVGAFVGFYFWGQSSYAESDSMFPGIVFIGGGALAIGLLAGCLQQLFWRDFQDYF